MISLKTIKENMLNSHLNYFFSSMEIIVSAVNIHILSIILLALNNSVGIFPAIWKGTISLIIIGINVLAAVYLWQFREIGRKLYIILSILTLISLTLLSLTSYYYEIQLIKTNLLLVLFIIAKLYGITYYSNRKVKRNFSRK